MEFYGYKTTKHKPKVFHEILDVLEYMINNHMIEIKQNLDSIGYDTGIEIKVIPENFDAADKFSKITSSQLDFIMMAESSINKENLLMAFLYINSYIYIRPRNNRNQEIMKIQVLNRKHFGKALILCLRNYRCQRILLTNV